MSANQLMIAAGVGVGIWLYLTEQGEDEKHDAYSLGQPYPGTRVSGIQSPGTAAHAADKWDDQTHEWEERMANNPREGPLYERQPVRPEIDRRYGASRGPSGSLRSGINYQWHNVSHGTHFEPAVPVHNRGSAGRFRTSTGSTGLSRIVG